MAGVQFQLNLRPNLETYCSFPVFDLRYDSNEACYSFVLTENLPVAVELLGNNGEGTGRD